MLFNAYCRNYLLYNNYFISETNYNICSLEIEFNKNAKSSLISAKIKINCCVLRTQLRHTHGDTDRECAVKCGRERITGTTDTQTHTMRECVGLVELTKKSVYLGNAL